MLKFKSLATSLILFSGLSASVFAFTNGPSVSYNAQIETAVHVSCTLSNVLQAKQLVNFSIQAGDSWTTLKNLKTTSPYIKLDGQAHNFSIPANQRIIFSFDAADQLSNYPTLITAHTISNNSVNTDLNTAAAPTQLQALTLQCTDTVTPGTQTA